MGNNSTFQNLRKTFLDSHVKNAIPKFQSCKLNRVAPIEKKNISPYIHTNILLILGNSMEFYSTTYMTHVRSTVNSLW